MHQHELSPQEQKRTLAGLVRNMLAAPNVVFSPWHTLDLAYHDGHLCKVAGTSHTRQYTPLFAQDQVYEMSDDAIWAAVTGEKLARETKHERTSDQAHTTRPGVRHHTKS